MGKNSTCLDFISDQLTRIRQTKAANIKQAARGTTEHPVMGADDGTKPAPEGARSSENTADVKANVPASVDSTKGTEGGGEGDHQLNVGLNQSATGEAPAVEDPDKIGKKDDAGRGGKTSHPASGDIKEGSFNKLSSLGDKIMAKIAMITVKAEGDEKPADASSAVAENAQPKTEEAGSKAKAAADTAVKATPKNLQPKAAGSTKEAGANTDFEAGRQAAKTAAEVLMKQAAAIGEVASSIEKKAAADAEAFCSFMKGYTDGLAKKADETDTPKDKVTDEEGQDDDKPKEDEGHEGSEPPAEEQSEESATPDEAAAQGSPLDAQGALGGMMDDGSGAAGGQQLPPEVLAQLMALLQGGGGGGADMGGGAPPMMDGAPPMGGGAPPMGGGGGASPEMMQALLGAVKASGAGPEAIKVAEAKYAAAVKRSHLQKRAMLQKRAAQAQMQRFFLNQINEIRAAEAAKAAPAGK